MQDRTAILDKIAALLKTDGRTPEEAAAYVAKANELAERHGIALYEATGRKDKMRTDVRETERMDIFEHGKPQAWRWEVLRAAAKAAGVRVMAHTRFEERTSKAGRTSYRRIQTAYFVGLPLDVEVAGYTYQFLVQEVERLATEHARPAWDRIRQIAKERGIKVHAAEMEYAEWNTHPLKQQASFRKGAAYGIQEALEGMSQARQATNDNTLALVVDREAAIRDYLYMKQYGKTYDEYTAEFKARMDAAAKAEEEANRNLPAKRQPKVRKWTKRDQERLEAASRRAARAEEARQNRYWKGVDVRSWSGGREAGRAMQVRPGIKGGEA